MNDVAKEELVNRFRAYLDATSEEALVSEGEGGGGPDGEGTDLYTLFVEMAGLRNEVRTESRLVKEALDQFRSVFDRLQADHAAMERELERTRAEERVRSRALLKPLLLELLEVRDRLAAGIKALPAEPRSWFAIFRRRRETLGLEAWREGQAMTLRRLDRLLLDRQVQAVDVVGRVLDPRLARAVAMIRNDDLDDGVVVEEVRPGFRWEEDLLRPADVVVNKRATVKEKLS